MTLRILIDMNLTPAWAPVLQAAGWEAIHWSHIGAPDAADSAIMTWAQQNHFVVFTHDLNFSIVEPSRVRARILPLRRRES